MKEEKEKKTKKVLGVIIGIMIVACLTLGVTLAYFLRSASNTTNLVTSEELSLLYSENTVYMYGDLIPIEEEDVISKGVKASEGNGICKDSNDHNVCALYEFIVTNTSNVTQLVDYYLYQKQNEYRDLYYMMFESSINDLTDSSVKVKDATNLVNNHEEYPGTLLVNNSTTITSNDTKTYTIVFYIKEREDVNQNYDTNKVLLADVHAIGRSAGTYSGEEEPQEEFHFTSTSLCWTTQQIDDTDNYRLTEFKGINQTDGTITPGCEDSVSGNQTDGYTVNIPSVVDGNNITNIGNSLLTAVDIENESMNYYQYINSINMSEGITTIEDSGEGGAFTCIGMDCFENTHIFDVEVNLPNSLEYIGNYAFYFSTLKSIIIPSNVVTIGEYAFSQNNISTLDLSRCTSLTTIEKYAFDTNYLNSITIPKSVETIGEDAFEFNALEEVIFEGAEDDTSNLTTIGEYAFIYNNLTYDKEDTPLLIPSSVTSIGERAFHSDGDYFELHNSNTSNPNLKYIKYLGENSVLATFPHDTTWDRWYNFSNTTLLDKNGQEYTY